MASRTCAASASAGRAKAHGVGGHQGQVHPLGECQPAAVDQLLGGIAMEGELEVQPVRGTGPSAAAPGHTPRRIGRVLRMLDRGRKDPATGHPVRAIRPAKRSPGRASRPRRPRSAPLRKPRLVSPTSDSQPGSFDRQQDELRGPFAPCAIGPLRDHPHPQADEVVDPGASRRPRRC